MLLSTLAHHRNNYHAKRLYDGKIGMCRFDRSKVGLRSSSNGPASTENLKRNVLTQDVYTEYLLKNVFPDIRAKLSFQRFILHLLQHYNARLRIVQSDPVITEAGHSFSGSTDLKIDSQSPRSSDFDDLDLSFFN